MTDKQIIIDDVDVSECEYLTETRHCKALHKCKKCNTTKNSEVE